MKKKPRYSAFIKKISLTLPTTLLIVYLSFHNYDVLNFNEILSIYYPVTEIHLKNLQLFINYVDK